MASNSTPTPSEPPADNAGPELTPKTTPKTAPEPVFEPVFEQSPVVQKRGGIGLVGALFLTACATAGGAYLSLLAQSRPDLVRQVGLAPFVPVSAPSPAANTAELDPLMARVAALENEVALLKTGAQTAATLAPQSLSPQTPTPKAPQGESAPTQTAKAAPPSQLGAPLAVPLTTDTSALKAELQGVSGRVTAIETRLAALDPTGAGGAILAGLQAEIANLKAVIAGLQQQAASAPSPAVSFALVNVAEAANRSGPFVVEFETLRAALPNVPEVAALEPLARSGVPTRTLLQERFATLPPALAATQAADRKESGLVAWFRSVLSGLIKVQPAPNAAGSGSEAALMRAKLKLDQGDLSGSADELATILGPPPQVTQWISQVRQRLELEGRISAVRGAAARVQAPSPQAPSPLAPPVASAPEPVAAPVTPKSPPQVEKNP